MKLTDSLTPRERQLLVLRMRGGTSKEAARDMGLSPHTVKQYGSNLFLKLHVTNIAAAAAVAGREGLS